MYNVIMFKKFILSVFIFFFSEVSMASCPKSLDFDIKLLGEDKTVNLCQEYLGKVILVVNTASIPLGENGKTNMLKLSYIE